MNYAALGKLFERHLASPLEETRLLRELDAATNFDRPQGDETLDLTSEIRAILTELYFQNVHADLILQIVPSLADTTIDPTTTAIRDPLPIRSNQTDNAASLPTFTLGATISPPSTIERLGDQSIQYSQTLLGETIDLGDAWVASDDLLQRQILLRELGESSQDHTDHVNDFVREAQIAGQLEHPNILPVYSLAWSPERSPYYTMKFVDGKSFHQHIQAFHENRPVLNRETLRDSLEMLLAVCNAISYAHSRGVYHGQLSSTAISLGQFGEVMVINWSHAILDVEDQDCTKLVQADLRAIASLLDELLSGTTADHTPTAVFAANIPRPLTSLLREACSTTSNYSSVADFADEIRAYLADQPLTAHRDTIPESILRWARHHPIQVLFGTATLLLLTFTLLTEIFILQRTNDQAKVSLQATRQLTTQLAQDNQQIVIEQQTQEKAAATAVAALTDAKNQLIAAEQSAGLALSERDVSRQLQSKSAILEDSAQAAYEQALEQDALAQKLLQQAQADELAAQKATLQIQQDTISALRKQITRHVLNQRNDLATQDARILFPFLDDHPPDGDHSLNLLFSLASYSHIQTSRQDTNLSFHPSSVIARTTAPDAPITITQFDPVGHLTRLHILESNRQKTYELDGRIHHYFQTPNKIVTINNEAGNAIVAIVQQDNVTYGRLSERCATAVLINDTLYAGLKNGHIVAFSLQTLVQSSPLTILPDQPHRLAISQDGSLLACNSKTNLRVINLRTAETEHSFSLPSPCEQLWFPSKNSVALITDQYYVNEFLLDGSGSRRIRFRPALDDHQLVDFVSSGDASFLLFAKGTVVRFGRQLQSNVRSVKNAINSRFLFVGPDSIIIRNRQGMLLSLDATSLRNHESPLILNSPIIAASRTKTEMSVVTLDGDMLVCERPYWTKSRHQKLSSSRKTAFSPNGHVFAHAENATIARLSPAGDATVVYKHTQEITDLYDPPGDSPHLIVIDEHQLTILSIDADGTLSKSQSLPLDVELGSFKYHRETNRVFLASPTTLYQISEGQAYSFSHPTTLTPPLNFTLSDDGKHALLSSLNGSSQLYLLKLNNLNYSPLPPLEGFIRNVFWSPSQQKFLIIKTNPDSLSDQQMIELDLAGNSKITKLGFRVKSVVFNPDTDDLIVGTPTNRVLRYSLPKHIEVASSQLPTTELKSLHLTADNDHLLVMAPDSAIVLDSSSLQPMTPLLEGQYLAPVVIDGVLHTIKQRNTSLIITDIPTLLGRGLTPEQIRAYYTQ